MTLLEALPLNETKLRILLEIYAEGEDYLRNIEKKTKINPSLLHRILKNLNEAGIINKKKKGKENYYRLTSEGKIVFANFLELFHLEKAIGRTQEIKAFFKLLINNKDIMAVCRNIYLFGSFVSGNITKNSDIDVIFVTKEKKKVMGWCHEAHLAIGREVNPLVYTPDKFKSDVRQKETTLSSIINNVKNRVIIE